MDAELQFILDSLSEKVGRPAAIDDRGFNVVAYSAHQSDDLDSLRAAAILTMRSPPGAQEWIRVQGVSKAIEPVRLAANQDLGMHARLCVPIRINGVLLGFIWFVEGSSGELSDDEVAVAVEAADAAATVLYRHQFQSHPSSVREAELMGRLLGSDPGARQEAAQALSEEGHLRDGAGAGVIVVRLKQPAVSEGIAAGEVVIEPALDRFRRSLAPHKCLTVARGDHGVALVAASEPTVSFLGLPGVAERLLGGLESATPVLDTPGWVAGCAMTAASIDGVFDAYGDALDAALVAQRVPSFAPVADWQTLGPYSYLAKMVRSCKPPVPASVRQLLELPAEGGLVETLECYLDLAGDVKASANALSLHRASLYYRLEKIESITGLDLKRGDDRLELQIGLKLARLLGETP
jgi:hypothetical protein